MARFAAIILGLTVLGASTQVLAQAVPSNVVPYPGPKPDPLLTANPTMVLSGAPPPPRLSLGINPSGATGPSEVFYNVLYSGAQYDTVDASQAPINPATLKINTNYGGTAKGGRTALRIAVNPTGPMVRTGTEVFNVGAEIFSTAGSNVGGTDDNAGAIGQIVPINTVGRAYRGATNWVVVSGFGEINMAVDEGASAAILNGLQISRLNTDAGEVSRFRAMIFAGTQPTTGAVNTIPPMDYGIVWGHDHHQWSFGDDSRMIGWIPQASGTNAGGAPLAASTLGWGVDLWGVNIRQQAWRSTGFAVQGDGSVNIGTGSITPTPEGITIDAKGQYVNGVSVAEPGRGYKPGEYLYGTQGDIYIVATVSSAGGVTALGIVGVGYAGHPAANPLAVTGGSGQGARLALQWSRADTITVNPTGNTIVGSGKPLSPDASSGFLMVPTSDGMPTGKAGAPGQAAIEVDTNNSRICANWGGGWKCATLN